LTTHHDLDLFLRGRPARAPLGLRRRALAWAARLARHRLAQFGVLGGLLFALGPKQGSTRDIAIDGARLRALHAAEASRNGVPLLDDRAARAVDQRALEDELLYREGVRLGLDKNDGIVRERVIQKVLFLAEELAGATKPPTDEELARFFERQRDRWSTGDHVTLEHVFQRSPEALEAFLAAGEGARLPDSEPCPLPRTLDVDLADLDTKLGAGFSASVATAPEGRWAGPFKSAYGYHLVRVEERRAARPPTLDEVRPRVVEAFAVDRRQEATARFLRDAFARYHVTVDGEPLSTFEPSRRIAFRAASSGED
jgi:hypothetical protein